LIKGLPKNQKFLSLPIPRKPSTLLAGGTGIKGGLVTVSLELPLFSCPMRLNDHQLKTPDVTVLGLELKHVST
jgi:hypothetical protein